MIISYIAIDILIGVIIEEMYECWKAIRDADELVEKGIVCDPRNSE